jgi:hypothetical protein
MAKWEMVHDEYLGEPNKTLTIFVAKHESGDSKVLFEVNDGGVRIRYYQTAKDAAEGEFEIADVCYGYNAMLWEDGDGDTFLDKVYDEQDSTEITGCGHDGSCEEEFARAQVALGNA